MPEPARVNPIVNTVVSSRLRVATLAASLLLPPGHPARGGEWQPLSY